MQDMAMTVHFKTRDRAAVPGGPAGGYARVYGRFEGWERFEEETTRHFRRLFRYDVVECEDKTELKGSAEPGAEHLVAGLGTFPIRFQSLHLYDHEG
jgi:hypothetical protein